MKIKRAVDIQCHSRTKLLDIYGGAAIYKSKSEEISKRIAEYKNKLPKDTPAWVKSYIDGYADALTKMLYQYKLEFCYLIDGRLVSTYKNSERYYEKMGYSISDLTDKPNGHYWIGSDKPYFNG